MTHLSGAHGLLALHFELFARLLPSHVNALTGIVFLKWAQFASPLTLGRLGSKT